MYLKKLMVYPLRAGPAGASSAARLQETPDFPVILDGERPIAATTQNYVVQPRNRLFVVWKTSGTNPSNEESA